MSLAAILVALMLEQYRPMPVQVMVTQPLQRYFAFLDRQFNDGQYRHGVVAWMSGVALPALLVAICHWLLRVTYPLLGLAFAVAVLYLTMGFRQFSHHCAAVQMALRDGELDSARKRLAAWRGVSGDRLSSGEIARLALEQGLLASHRHVFAPLIAFALLGPGGALLYRLARVAHEYWRSDLHAVEATRFGEFSRRALTCIEWLPLRLTAIGYAVVGDFEDAIFCWRSQASLWPQPDEGILLSSGAGALGVRLGLPLHDGIGIEDRPELGLGDEADADFMQSMIGLVWRTLLLGLLLIALVWVAGLFG